MKKNFFLDDISNTHIHFVGIKGTGMTALVELLHAQGALITGSDVSDVFYTDEILKKLSINVLPFSEKNITKDVSFVIYSSAYNVEQNPDLIAAKKQNVECILYTEALGFLSEKFFSVGICGVHGKTSTTGLSGSIFSKLDLPLQVLAGSAISSFGGNCTFASKTFNAKNSKNYFVAETCEYQNHFLSFSPKIIILTSVESDHQDFFPTYESIKNAFVSYIRKLPIGGTLIYCADDKGARDVANFLKNERSDIHFVPYGENASGDYKVSFSKVKAGEQFFALSHLGEFSIFVPGKHIALDAVAAIALASELLQKDGKNPKDYAKKIQEGLSIFRGGKRRSEIIGRALCNSVDTIFIDDYAHHPTAIKKTLAGYKDFYKNRKIIVDFMSHTYTRTASLLEDFASSFSDADVVILHKIYGSAREDASSAAVTGVTLFEKTKTFHKNVHYFEEVLEAKSFVKDEISKTKNENFAEGVLFVTMGAGDNWKLGKELFGDFRKH
ncbi:MAG: UDP-N-acetylmuramate--L-alanine ligase [Treponema sp.]|nr:UDP-N-acetylmuramate--L-alanine ligase [Treponema sp.]